MKHTTEHGSTFTTSTFLGKLHPSYYYFRTDIQQKELYAGMIVGYSRFTAEGTMPRRQPKLLIWDGDGVIEQAVDSATDQRYPDEYIIDPEWFVANTTEIPANSILGYVDSPRKFTVAHLLKWNGRQITEAPFHTFQDHKLELHQLIFPDHLQNPHAAIASQTMIGVDFGSTQAAPIKYLYWINGQIYSDARRLYHCIPFDELFSTDDKTINYDAAIDPKARHKVFNGLPQQVVEKIKRSR